MQRDEQRLRANLVVEQETWPAGAAGCRFENSAQARILAGFAAPGTPLQGIISRSR